MKFINILFVLFTISIVSLQGMDFQIKEIAPGIYNYKMVTARNGEPELLGIITPTHAQSLQLFTTPVFDSITISNLPAEVARLVTVIQAVNAQYDLNEVVLLGDLHVPVAHRGKGYAKLLLNKICHKLFGEGVKTIILIPDPFEYEDNKQTLLEGRPDYESKKESLIRLYQKCGFTVDDSSPVLYMYRQVQ